MNADEKVELFLNIAINLLSHVNLYILLFDRLIGKDLFFSLFSFNHDANTFGY